MGEYKEVDSYDATRCYQVVDNNSKTTFDVTFYLYGDVVSFLRRILVCHCHIPSGNDIAVKIERHVKSCLLYTSTGLAEVGIGRIKHILARGILQSLNLRIGHEPCHILNTVVGKRVTGRDRCV